MDIADYRLITDASVVVCDFDGTLVRLQVDWGKLKIDLKEWCEKEFQLALDFESGLDNALYAARRLKGEAIFQACCQFISLRERLGFNIDKQNKSLLSLLSNLRIQSLQRKFAILSSNTHRAIAEITSLSVWPFPFDAIVAKEDVCRAKPASDGMEILRSKWREFADNEFVLIGDSDVDRLTAESISVPFVHVEKW